MRRVFKNDQSGQLGGCGTVEKGHEHFVFSAFDIDLEDGAGRVDAARRALRRSGLLEERRVGMPAKLWFRVRPDAVWRALQAHAGASHR